MKRKLNKDDKRKIKGKPKNKEQPYEKIENHLKAFGKLSVKRKEYIRKTKGMPKGARREIEGKSTGKP